MKSFVILVLVASLLPSGVVTAGDILVTAEGQAACEDSTAHCRQAAIADALRKAVEDAVGVFVESRTKTKNYRLVEDTIRMTSEGFVRKYRILDEWLDSKICRVKIEAQVAPGRPDALLRSICSRLKEEVAPTFKVSSSLKPIANEISRLGLAVTTNNGPEPTISIRGSVRTISIGEAMKDTGIFSSDAVTSLIVEGPSGFVLPSVNMSLDKPKVGVSQEQADEYAVQEVSRLWVERNIPLIGMALLKPGEFLSDSDAQTSESGGQAGEMRRESVQSWAETRTSGCRTIISDGAIVELAQKLGTAVKQGQIFESLPAEVAVSRFKAIGLTDPNLVEDVLEDLSTALVKTGVFQLVERNQLDRVLAELRIENSGLVDSTVAKRLGRLIGAKAVLIGSISDRKDCYVINARLINTETGLVQVAESVVIPKDPEPRILRA